MTISAVAGAAWRLRSSYLRIVALELRRLRIDDIDAARAVILLALGERRLTAGVVASECHDGRNAAYNLLKLSADGWVSRTVSTSDGRLIWIEATPKGLGLIEAMRPLHERLAERLDASGPGAEAIAECARVLRSSQACVDAAAGDPTMRMRP